MTETPGDTCSRSDNDILQSARLSNQESFYWPHY